jgi:hypothetical protein
MTLTVDRRPMLTEYRYGAADRIVLASGLPQFEVLGPAACPIATDLHHPATRRNLANRQHPRHTVRPVSPSLPPHRAVPFGVEGCALGPATGTAAHPRPEAGRVVNALRKDSHRSARIPKSGTSARTGGGLPRPQTPELVFCGVGGGT